MLLLFLFREWYGGIWYVAVSGVDFALLVLNNKAMRRPLSVEPTTVESTLFLCPLPHRKHGHHKE